MMQHQIIILLTLAGALHCQILQLKAGSNCTHNSGSPGICKPIEECPQVKMDLRKRIIPITCSFEKKSTVVCCSSGAQKVGSSVVATPRSTTTTLAPFRYQNEPVCESHAPTGQKAIDKCWEYYERLVKPCQPSPLPNGGMIRVDHCNRKPEDLITGGKDAYYGEFPHMVLLGFGKDSIEWSCGGVLLSERYVLTAGHCTSTKSIGPVTKLKVGILERDESDADKVYDVLRIIRHPKYRSPIKYHDMALLQSDREIKLSRYVVPACLHDGSAMKDEEAIVTGWGTTVHRRKMLAQVLQKATVTKFQTDECSRKYKKGRNMPTGFDADSQMCYGDRTSNKDSCNGDSGGPLQLKHPDICMYNVIGIISFGMWCGYAGEPGIYSRVAPDLAWIEETVWP